MERAETYELILNEADKLFRRFGPMKTPVRDIARGLNMSSANIYKFFPSKRAIIEAVMERRQAGLRQDILTATNKCKGAFERIACLMFCVLDHFETIVAQESDSLRLEIALDILQLETISHRKSWDFIRNFHNFLYAQILRFIKDGISSGEMHVPDAEDAAAGLLDCLSRVFEPILLLDDPKPVRRERLKRQLRLLKRALA
jgi:AcrR family transcriptional regulator